MMSRLLVLSLISGPTFVTAFAPQGAIPSRPSSLVLFETAEKETESAFQPLEAEDPVEEKDESFDKVEKLGRGSAKVSFCKSSWLRIVWFQEKRCSQFPVRVSHFPIFFCLR